MTRQRHRVDVRAAVAALAAACAIAGVHAADAEAYDTDPCGKEHRVNWTNEPVQLCPLTALADGNRIPVYTSPVANPRGRAIPSPRTFIGAASGTARFVCESAFPKAVFYHPSGWRNVWWARTVAADGKPGWVPEVYFKGGGNDESDPGLRTCDSPKPPVPARSPPPPATPCEPTPAASGLRLKARFAGAGQVRPPVTVADRSSAAA